MRRMIDRLFTPAFDAIVGRFDPPVEFDDHLRFLDRLPTTFTVADEALNESLHAIIATALGEIGLPHDRFGESTVALAASWAAGHGDERALAAHGQRLDACINSSSETNLEIDERSFEAASKGAFDWLQAPEQASRAALACLVAERSGCIPSTQIHAVLTELVSGFEPRQWFIARRGVLHGTSALLRALISYVHGHSDDDPLGRYVGEVLDRLLKHVEVRREEALRLAETARPDASQAQERIRFTFALLEGSAAFGDLRLLNAALKRNDLHLAELCRKGRHRDDLWWIELAAYASSIALQERHMKDAFA